MITVLAKYERISVFHTMTPFFSGKHRKLFKFTRSAEYCLKHDRNSILIMERWFKDDNPPDLGLMERLRAKYRTIAFFDGYAAAGTHLLEVLPYVDLFYHKSVFTDKNLYKQRLFSKRLFADYYHNRYGIGGDDPEYTYIPDLSDDDTERIKLSWNIGIGDYPRRYAPQRAGVLVSRLVSVRLGRMFKSGNSVPPPDFSSPGRSIDVHSRLGLVSNPAVAYHRKLYLDIIKNDRRFLTGAVPQKQYYKELFDSKIVFSPFGWGEVCFRDFEAVISGAMLLKPDMSHLITWPDIYIPYETYVPVDWDGTDFLEKSGEYLSDGRKRKRIAENAWVQYRKELDALDSRAERIIHEIIDS